MGNLYTGIQQSVTTKPSSQRNFRQYSRSSRRTSARVARLLVESLESRTLLSAVDLSVGALPSVAATPTVSSTPVKMYRVAALAQESSDSDPLPAVDAQSYFNLLKHNSQQKPVLTETITKTAQTSTTANLEAYATFAGTGGDQSLNYTWSVTSAPTGAVTLFSANGNFAAHQTVVTFNRAGSYTFSLTINNGANVVNDSLTLNVAAVATSLNVTPAGALQILPNSSKQFVASLLDQFGQNIATPMTWSNTGTGSIDGTGLYQGGAYNGVATVTAAAGGLTASANVTVINPPPTIATPASASTTNVTGTTVNLSVLGADDGGEANLTYSWAAISAPAGSSVLFSANGNNAAKNTLATFNKAGAYTFVVSISDGTSVVTGTVLLTVAQTTSVVNVTPGSVGLSVTGTQTFTASALDQFGNALATQPAFTWSKVSGVGSINSGGLYSAGSTGGSAVIRATYGGFFGQATVSVGNASPTIATPASASGLTTNSVNLSVLGADDGGEPNLTYSWTLSSGPTGAAPAFSINGSNAAKNTTVTFNRAGNYTFLASISDGTSSVTSAVNVTVAAVGTSITVNPGSLAMNNGVTQQFSATLFDQFNQAISGASIAWSVDSGGDGSINTGGLFTAGGSVGTANVRATAGGISNYVVVSVAVPNTAPTVATAANASSSSVTGTTVALSTLGADNGGEPNLTYTWSLTATPSGGNATFSINGTNASKNTVATFTKAGAYTFLVTISDGSLACSSSVSLTVVQTASGVTVSPNTAGLASGTTQQFSAAVVDQFNQTMVTSVTWSVDSGGDGSINTGGLFTAGGSVGTAKVRATAGGSTNYVTVTVSVTNTAPTVATAANASSTSVTGTTVNLSTLGADNGGEPNLTYTWSLTATPSGGNASFSINGTNASKNTVATFTKAGAYTFLVTISDGSLTCTSSVALTVVQTVTSINVNPGSVALSVSGTQSFTASALDQFGNALASQPSFAWSEVSGVGSINSSGLYSAGNAGGSATIRATSSGVYGQATVTVNNNAPTVATAANAGSTSVTGTTVNLSTLGADDGGEPNLTYSWSLTATPSGGSATFSINGTNASKNTVATFTKAGAYTFLVTISDGSLTCSSSVALTVVQTATGVTVSPNTAGLSSGTTQQFSAAIVDQFNQTMITSVTWTVDSGGAGTVNSTGLFTAGNSSGSATVRATSGGVSGTAGITVTAPSGGGVTVTTRNMTSFTELDITGTSSFDTITVSQSGTTFTIVGDGVTQNITGTFGDLVIHAGSAGSNITVNSSVNINTLLYGGAGTDTLINKSTGAYTMIVSIGGGADTLTGNGVSTNYWADTSDTVNSTTAENNAGDVNKVSAFYQPWTTDSTNPNYVPLSLAGQTLAEPTDTGTIVHYTSNSLWGTAPVMTDVRQNQIGDCYYLADIMSMAGANPARLETVAADLGDGTYVVRYLRTTNQPSFVRVDGNFSGLQCTPGASGNIWAVVLEKAYAYFRLGSNTYNSLNSGWMTNVTWDFGWNAGGYGGTSMPSSAAALATAIASAATAKQGLTVGTGTVLGGAALIADHAYAVVGYSVTNGVYTFYLRNPWGYDGVSDGSDPSDGIVGVSYSQFMANFSEMDSCY